MQSVLQTLGLNQYSCTSLSVPAFFIECLKNPRFHGDAAPGQLVFCAKKDKKSKSEQQVGSWRKGRPSAGQEESDGHKSPSFLTWDAEIGALGLKTM